MSFDSATIAALRRRIAEERQKSVDLMIGRRCEDYADYRGSCLYIKALDDVNQFIDEITSDLQRDNECPY